MIQSSTQIFSRKTEQKKSIHQKRIPSIEELSKRIRDLEDDHALLKQKMLKFTISGDRKTSNAISSRKGTHHSALNLTEADYFNILQSISQPIHISDSKGYVIYRNHAWNNFYGYTSDEIRGKCFLDLVIDPKDIPIADDIVQQMLKGECWTGEFPVRNKRGKKFDIIGSSKPFRDENGKIIGVISISASPRPYQQIKLGVPTRLGRTSSCSSMVNGTSPLSSKSEWKGNEQGGCFDFKTNRSYWHWLHSEQEHEYGLRMNAKVENQPWMVNNYCVGHDNKALSRRSLFDYSAGYEIKWEDLMIRGLIGRDSRGSVYHAVWHGSNVAVKLYSKQEHSHDLIVSFTRKVSLMKRLRHPNILLFMGTVSTPQYICIVTEFLRRGNLFSLLHQNRARLDWRRRICMAIGIAQGISYLHHCLPPIIHCDLNSSNLLVDRDWTVKVGDFGLSRTKHETFVPTKERIGSPQWMAPEVLRNEQADERSDVYSYGVVLWEITTEKIPWDGLNSMQVMEAVGLMNQGLDIPKDVDPQWASLIQRCLCSEPQSRPTFQEILEELHLLHMRFKFMVPLHEDSRGVRNYKCERDA